ncbi:MAG: polysaccharide biosynthesis tyrosine autokinase [Verrucomicrobia bacterium]|nr:polysaccharide biosynthesis tyrosine autokinase [Verrucomicrobiota bacterium]
METQPPASPDSAPAQRENVNLRHYWHVVLERRWLVLTAFISVFVLSLVYLYKAPKIYQAVARIEINREENDVLNLKDVLSIDTRDMDYMQTVYKNLKSRTLIESVINQLHLENDERYLRVTDIYKAVDADIQIVPTRLSRLVDIKVEHTNPEAAQKIANTLVNKFLEDNLDRKLEKSRYVSRFLDAEAENLKQKVQAADKRLQDYQVQKGSVSLEERQNVDLLSLQQAQTDLSKAQTESAIAQTNAAEVANWIRAGVPLETIPQVSDELAIKDMRRTLAVQTAELEGLLKIYKDKMPVVLQARERLASLTNSIAEQAERIVATVYKKAELARSVEISLENVVKQRKQVILDLSQQRIEYATLSREAASTREALNKVLDRQQESAITGKSKTNNMRVVDDARKPQTHIKPRSTLTIVLGFVGGWCVAIGLAFFVNYLDDSIKSQDDVETYLRLPFLGYIPNIKTNSLVERDMQAHLHPRSNAAEAFRTIRAAISLMPRADKFRILAVTSTIPSEGKSLVAANLAIVNAQTGLKTLLVDADLRRPAVHKGFQLHSPIGLSAYLTEEINNFEECVHTTDVPNLDVVCCGAIPTTPSELIGSKRMSQFLQEVRMRYDRVVLDCPPVSAVSDPLVLAAKSDGVVFVTKFNKIRREHSRRTVQRLQDSGIFILGVILNDIDFEGRDSYYYSYYYYQNRYYASHYKSDKVGSEKAPDKEKAKKA